jgi:hypothetical protein
VMASKMSASKMKSKQAAVGAPASKPSHMWARWDQKFTNFY